jgi:ubiquinone/menaquinone biosynthesis C-methylase UbiE
MGAADARDAVLHVSGHLDVFAAAEVARAEGRSLGEVSLMGCLVDAQRFVDDLVARRTGTLDDARREIAAVEADVLWMRGEHDAWMDPRRIEDLMSIPARGARDLVAVPSGHVPRTGEQAVAQFAEIAQWLERRIEGRVTPVRAPGLGWLEAESRLEWARVRREGPRDAARWWADYLLDDRGPGFDILRHSPDYLALVELQVERLDAAGQDVLELGAGTGNLTARLARVGPRSLVATDVVPEAVARLERALRDAPAVRCLVVDADGGPWVALARALRGELGGPEALFRRLPGVPADLAARLGRADPSALVALLRGHPVRVPEDLGLPADTSPATLAVLEDLRRMAAAAAAGEPLAARLAVLHPGRERTGLPFPDASFDRVMASLVLSYLEHPDDALSEIRRVLRPGGRLVLSSMRRDADASRLFLDLVARLEATPAEALGGEAERAALLEAARRFMGRAAELFRLEEEGVHRFFDAAALSRLLRLAGFEVEREEPSFGDPAQALVVTARRPR